MNDQYELRTQVQNIQKTKLLSDVEIGETWETGRAKDDVEALNEESHEVDGDLEAATEEERNVDVAEACVSNLFVLMYVGEEKKLGY